jgi:hypothetical protein
VSAEQALRRLADEDGRVETRTLPPAVTDRMQWVVDNAVEMCVHVQVARDLPSGALPKLCIQGVPLIYCTQPVCVFDATHRIKVWRGVQIDESCTLCGRQQTNHRTVFEDQAAGLSMVGFVCASCVERLAAWVGVP